MKLSKHEVMSLLSDSSVDLSRYESLIHSIKRSKLRSDPDIRAALRLHSYQPFNTLEREITALVKLEQELLGNIGVIGSQFQTPSDELIHTLCALEIAQRKRFRLTHWDAVPCEIDDQYPDGGLYESGFDALSALDYFLTYFGVALRKLVDNSKQDMAMPAIDPNKIQIAGGHFAVAADWQQFYEMRSFWEHGCTQVLNEGSVFDSGANELVVAFRISLSRLRAFRVCRCSDQLNTALIKTGTNLLPPHAFRSHEELVSAHMTSLQYYSRDLSEEVHGAKLSEWIRAYVVLKEVAGEKIASMQAINDASDLLIKAPKSHYVDLLIRRGGIPVKTAGKIVDHLTFNESAKDLLDAPLVAVGDNLLLLPSVTFFIQPAFSLESLLKSIRSDHNHEINFIGPGLEASLRGDLAEAGVLGRKVVHKKFDCDIAFVLQDVLFMCECKGKFIASEFRNYADLEHYLTTDVVTQHTRTCDYFTSNLHHMRRELKLPATWEPREIKRLIITSAKLGRSISKDGFIIVDENTFHGFFSRVPLRLTANGKTVREAYDPRLAGDLTAESFLDYIESPPVMLVHRKLLAAREVRLSTTSGDYALHDVECYGEVRYQ